ncbi:response regulator transcription factor [Alteromonas antoniana]|jgi:FixJ family two-component response regulator|uniref:response regulator transcription factor n=1 Tax=Alteromonas antoniana TaxID=2803813 RepID=UPI001C461CD6|nr:response regulator transcription factor [Alteromonas antoniana]
MVNNDSIIYIVDDDHSVLEALSSLVRSIGLDVICFSSADAFLQQLPQRRHGCLILDVRMPEMSGLDIQKILNEKHHKLPIIFISGHGDIPMAVQAVKEGAIDFLTKPFREEEILSAIRTALKIDLIASEQHHEQDLIRRRYASLSEREKQVLPFILKGYLNKQTAIELGISEATVKVHRHNIMIKMETRSLPEIVRDMGKIGR